MSNIITLEYFQKIGSCSKTIQDSCSIANSNPPLSLNFWQQKFKSYQQSPHLQPPQPPESKTSPKAALGASFFFERSSTAKTAETMVLRMVLKSTCGCAEAS